MEFPKSIIVLQDEAYIKSITETGEATRVIGKGNDCMKFLSQALGFTYKTYPFSMAERVNASIVIPEHEILEKYYDVSFYPFTHSEITFATKKPEANENTFAFMNPFQPYTWLAIIITTLFCSVTYYYMFSKRVSLASALFYTCCSFLRQDHEWRPKWPGQRVLVLTWSVGIMIISLSYGSALLSFLTIPTRERGLQNFDDLYHALSTGKATITTARELDINDDFTNSTNPAVKLLVETLKKHRKVYGRQYFTDIKKDHALLHLRTVLQGFYGSDFYRIADDNLQTMYHAMYGIEEHTKGGFCCKDAINMVIHRIWAAGLMQKADNYFIFILRSIAQSLYEEYVIKDKDPQKPLRLFHFAGAFYLLIVGLVSGVICLLCEIVFHKLRKKKNQIRSL